MDFLRSLLGGGKSSGEHRVLFLGWPGKTTFLYGEALGEELALVIPTIGFNVELLTAPGGAQLRCWDVGGCDRIRALVRHYYDGAEAVLFFIGTCNLDQLRAELDVLHEFLHKYALPPVPLCLFCTQRDLPTDERLSDDAVLEAVVPVAEAIRDRPCIVVFGSARSRESRAKALAWIEAEIRAAPARRRAAAVAAAAAAPRQLENGAGVAAAAAPAEGAQPVPRSETDALSDDAFLAAVEDYTLPAWDHKTHLRLAYLVLVRQGRRQAVSRIMQLISDFIDHSPRTSRGKRFHVTLTYFWIHMVHYAVALEQQRAGTGEAPAFEALLAARPWLLDGGLFRRHYSDDLLLRDPAARTVFVLPDKEPLPSLLPPSAPR